MPGIEHILINPFLNATKISLGHALTIGDFTYAALGRPGAPAEIVALYNAYYPVFENFRNLYSSRGTRRGDGKSKTQAQKGLLSELSERIKNWGLQIEMVHRRDSPEYLAFLPRGRRPFRHGKIETRAAAVRALALALQGIPAFSALHAEVEAFSAALSSAIEVALGARTKKANSSNALEAGRIQLCHALYAALGGLINLYPDRPDYVAIYFDTATMHRHRHRKKVAKATDVEETAGDAENISTKATESAGA